MEHNCRIIDIKCSHNYCAWLEGLQHRLQKLLFLKCNGRTFFRPRQILQILIWDKFGVSKLITHAPTHTHTHSNQQDRHRQTSKTAKQAQTDNTRHWCTTDSSLAHLVQNAIREENEPTPKTQNLLL